MSVYVITGVSRGIGFEFLKQLSEDPMNLVVGLVRDKAGTEKKAAAELGDRPNIHILHGDLTKADNPEELEKVVADLTQTNVVGNIHLFNLFLPLVLKGKAKKVIALTTGLADVGMTNSFEVDISGLYAASKAALNMIASKFNVQYKKDGVLFISISPGVVEVAQYDNITPEQQQGLMGFMGKVAAYSPDFKGPITPEQSVKQVRATWEKASIDTGFGGAFVSHHGDKNWI
ncbi:hypothetical protein KVR01_007983 [Diaporthe batatas]|uniref:uncharacterized protein n=1 Tax=Diaporthe batatas TaxID=748121 RepID=UPI001D03D731|nr:uncharacterized protein KVR01_007983 [Diaporthe batatas]KAG8162218.1 hypothetical protein KVR01_007983 [Diaporthe batatas]